jgi:outer membrane protein TolC
VSISLSEAQKLAQEQNQGLKIAQDQYQTSQARVQQSQAKNSPQIGLSLKPSTGIGPGSSLRAQFGLDFTKALPGSSALAVADKTNQLDRQIADRALAEARRELMLQVETAYFNLLKAEQILVARDENLKRSELQLKTSQLQEKAGTGTKLDVMQMQVALSESKQSHLEAQNSVRKTSAALAILLGLPSDAEIKVSKPELKIQIPSLDEALTLLNNRSEVLDQQAAIEKAQLAVGEAERQKEMELSFFGSLSQEKGDLTLNLSRQNVGANLSLDPLQETNVSSGWQVGVQASWDLVDGGVKDAAIAETQFQLSGEKGRLTQLMTQLEQEIRALYWDLEALQARVKTAEDNLSTSKEAWNAAKMKFEYGSGSASEVVDFEVALTEAETGLINANFDYLLQQRQLLFNLCLEEETL